MFIIYPLRHIVKRLKAEKQKTISRDKKRPFFSTLFFLIFLQRARQRQNRAACIWLYYTDFFHKNPYQNCRILKFLPINFVGFSTFYRPLFPACFLTEQLFCFSPENKTPLAYTALIPLRNVARKRDADSNGLAIFNQKRSTMPELKPIYKKIPDKTVGYTLIQERTVPFAEI